MTSFFKFNLLNSKSIDDVRVITLNETMFNDLKPGETFTFKYAGPGDAQYAPEWKYEDFDYTINYHGFRMNSIPEEVDIGVFGCSFTFGTAMPVEGMWHTLIGKELNCTVGNFGIGGLSATSVLDLFLIVSKHVKMKKAVFLLPSFNRYQYAKRNPETGMIQYLNIIPNHDSRLCKWYGIDADLIYKAISEEQLYKEVRNGINLVEHISKERGVQVYFTTWDHQGYEFMKMMNFTHAKLLPEWRHPHEYGNDVGRDNRHPGFKLNRYFADQIIPHIK